MRVVMPNGEVTLVYLEVTAKAQAPDTITFAVNKDQIALNVGETDQLTVSATTEHANGEVTRADVTESASYEVGDGSLLSVDRGFITGLNAGTTTITVKYADFTATVAVTVEAAPVTEPETQKYTVTEESITGADIVLDLTAFENEVDIEINASALQQIVKNKKDVTIQTSGASFSLHKNILKDLQATANGDVTISVTKADASGVTNAVSDIYTLSFWNGTGEGKQQLSSFSKQQIEIVIQVSSNGKKVSVVDALTGEVIVKNTNIKNGAVNFKTKNAGSYVAIPN